MRIVSYNILDGGVGRADPLAEVLLAQRADIIALVEADDPAVLERIAWRGQMDFIRATAGAKGAALLSHWRIQQTIDHAALHPGLIRALLEGLVIDPSGFEWIIGVLHLDPKATQADEERRMNQIAVVLDIFKRHRDAGRPHLLVGDFNSNSPIQEIDPAKCKPATREASEANGGKIPRTVVQMMLDYGYIDTLQSADLEAAKTLGSFSTQFPGQRVDYIFAWGMETGKIVRAWIEQDRLAKYASDHFPVGAEVNE